MKPWDSKFSVVAYAALDDFPTTLRKLISVFCVGASISSFCEQLVIASAAKAANKIFFIFCVF